MVYKEPVKTKQEWDKIKWENNLGVQIGACVNKSVDLVIASNFANRQHIPTPEEAEKLIKYWVDILYKIGTEKKSQILKNQEPKPLTQEDIEKADRMGHKILNVENQEEKAGLEETRTNNIPF